jgi:hypothetical protein
MPTGSNLVLGQVNTASDPTIVDISPGTSSGVMVRSAAGIGVVGDPALNTGILGTGQRGVTGLSFNDVGIGVAGLGSQVGVAGDCLGATSVGVRGTADFLGVLGTASTAITNKMVAGVQGSTTNRMGLGVNGQSAALFGVRGLGGGTPTATNVVGVMGVGRGAVAHGVIGDAPAPGFAGFFFGNFAVTGTKGAAVRLPDGSHRLLCAIESPESWFEDFGAGRLVRGRAAIKLDPTFRAVVRGAYHVFLTPEGDCRGLYVAAKSPRGFEVRELQGGRTSVPFSYRIVARRRDVTGPRFARVQPPKLPRGVDVALSVPKAQGMPAPEEARKRARSRK